MIPANLLNHLWQSTVFAIAAGLLTLALKKNPAPVRYWLWFTASVKFLIPFSLLVTIGTQVEWRKVQPVQPMSLPVVMEQISQPFTPSALTPLAAKKPMLSSSSMVLCLWLGGFSVVAVSWARQWRRIRTAIRVASPLRLNLPIQVMSSPARLEPGVFGILRSVLVVPEGITDRLTPAQWDAIVAHELCHVRRRDNLTAAIHMVVEAVFWFHPLVWWIGKRLVDERERACDEEVLRLGSKPQVYAEGILNVCKLYVESPLVCVSGVTGSNLKRRIAAIMNDSIASRLNLGKKGGLIAAGVAAVAMPVVIGMLNAPAIRAQAVPAGTQKFEVASIRLGCGTPANVPGGGKGGGGSVGSSSSPDRLSMCTTVEMLIRTAYERFADGHPFKGFVLQGSQNPLEGGAGWINSERYQINAKAEGTPGMEMMHGPMLQGLLEDRFKLKVRRETRDVPVYELTVAKGGLKLKPREDGACAPVSGKRPPNACGNVFIGSGTLDVYGISMPEYAQDLRNILNRPVVDKTGITGVFDFHLKYLRDDAIREFVAQDPALVPAGDPAGAPSIFTAVQEQFGLKLEPAKGPDQFLVIEHVERPTDN